MRELDAKVAQRVLDIHGCTHEPQSALHPEYCFECKRAFPKKFTSEPAADYEVLRHVRETWDEKQRGQFRIALVQSLAQRTEEGELFCERYEPGDFARAALKVVGE